MMRTILLSLLSIALLAPVARAEDLVDVTLTPWSEHDGVDRPYRFLVEVRPRGAEPVEVLADRRVLSFTVRPSEGRRRYTCRHPQPQGRASTGRVRTLTLGSAEDVAWLEWIDVRMYCTGRALAALNAGAQLEARYGWPRASRTRWIARRPGSSSPREWQGGAELPARAFPAQPEQSTRLREGEGEVPIELALTPTSARTGAALTLRAAVRAREGTERVYVRADAFAFTVRGPLGDVRCDVETGGGSPPPDLFRRITTRRAARESLDADFFCPEDSFEVAGVYEITPELTLEHSGEEWELDAVTGRFVGPTVPVRITHGERGYVEQIPEPVDDGD